jgi:hypothetical protein
MRDYLQRRGPDTSGLLQLSDVGNIEIKKPVEINGL